MYGAYDSLFWLLFRGADMLRKNVMNTPADNEKRNQCAEYRRREAIRLIKRNKGECEIIELLHQMNIYPFTIDYLKVFTLMQDK